MKLPIISPPLPINYPKTENIIDVFIVIFLDDNYPSLSTLIVICYKPTRYGLIAYCIALMSII